MTSRRSGGSANAGYNANDYREMVAELERSIEIGKERLINGRIKISIQIKRRVYALSGKYSP